jgi:SAM-dependent methyltransferase
MFLELQRSFTSLDDWNTWSADMPQVRDPKYIDEIARSISTTGFVDPLFGVVAADQIVAKTGNYREGFRAWGSTSRHRALLKLVLDHVLASGWCSPIYLAEHATDFAEAFSTRFSYVVRSEYMPNPVVRFKMPHVKHEDPVALTLPDRSFDMYISADSMSYAPDMKAFLQEARRVLRRTGVLLATFPFRYGEPHSEIRAQVLDGEVVHHSTPSFDLDPLSGARSRLVFFIPGWDILEVARSVGFRAVEFVAQTSRTHAILGAEIATVFVLRALA